MKSEIHPMYYQHATISCACGKTYQIGSTKESTQIELCAACHPFYTGTQKIVDSARRVEKFKARVAKKAVTLVTKKEKHAKKRAVRKTKIEA